MLRNKILSCARELRKNQTIHESILWDKIRNKKFLGLKFYRQYPLSFIYENHKRSIIADFYCRSKNLIIELDGKSHDLTKEKDEQRDFLMTQKGIRTLRFTNDDVESNLEGVLSKIKIAVSV